MSDAPLPLPRDDGSKRSVIPNADALAALHEIVAATREYGRIRQEETTKRAAIAAVEHIQVDRIHAAEKILRLYFERVFAERAQTSEEMFVRLDQAMDSGDPQMVHAVVRGIVDLAQASPLAGLEDFGKFWAELGTGDNPVEL
jgi:phage tail tape-measure protein